MTKTRKENMQSRPSQPEAIADTESEAYQTLLARAHRRTGGVPAERIVRHVLSVTHGGDWPRPARRARSGAPPLRVRAHGRDSDRRTAAAADCWVCTRPAATDRAHARTARCSAGSSRSTAVASAPISSGARSGCASTSSPSSRTWSRSGVASDVERESAPELGTVALGSDPPADRPWRLARARSLGRRHARPRSAALAACNERTSAGPRGFRDVAAAGSG